MTPYYEDDTVQLYLGDMREILPVLNLRVDLICTDPPYGETSLAWDRWPDSWTAVAASCARSMWCFGSARMFDEHVADFGLWHMSQDVIWEKARGTSFTNDRFVRVHEHARHYYQGRWDDVHHETPRVAHHGPRQSPAKRRASEAAWHGKRGNTVWEDDGTRLQTSVLFAPKQAGRSIHPTEKPIGLLDPLIRYACPPGGLVLDPFAGSGATLDAARQSGRRAIGIEANEPYAEAAARRLSALTLPG